MSVGIDGLIAEESEAHLLKSRKATMQIRFNQAKAVPKAAPSTSHSQLEPPCTLAVSVDEARISGIPVPTIEGIWGKAVAIILKSDAITQYHTSLK